MLFTRTIRRTMVCGLAMVLFMMIGLSLSAIYSHFSYRDIIRKLQFTFNECPRKMELVEALLRLDNPLALRIRSENPKSLAAREREFRQAVEAAEAETDKFIKNLTAMPPDRQLDQSSKPLGHTWALQIFSGLNYLKSRSPELSEPDAAKRLQALQSLKDEVDAVQALADQIPNFQNGVPATIEEARSIFQRGFWLVSGSGVIAVIVFLWLIVYGYLWVFSPLRKLHQGALRVAQGDFDYRLQLARQDEMKELADAFNSMTSRFQEIRGNLDRQVRERIKQLIRSERLAGIGFLAAGVAHEINNPLSAIAMASESLTDRLAEGSSGCSPEDAAVTRQYLDMIQREAFRCQNITRRLLDFARGNSDRTANHDLTAIVNDVLGVVRHMNRYNDRSVRFNRSTPCCLEINGPEIQQVVMNLVSNGLEAMDSGGTMQIDIIEETDHVTLQVTDDGCGMTTEVIDNLFEPFFTQRRNGRGTGLGLSISHRIVADHGGRIEVESAGPGQGSTFLMRLPKRQAQRDAA